MNRCAATTAAGRPCRQPTRTGDCGRHHPTPIATGVPTAHTSSVVTDPMAPPPTTTPSSADPATGVVAYREVDTDDWSYRAVAAVVDGAEVGRLTWQEAPDYTNYPETGWPDDAEHTATIAMVQVDESHRRRSVATGMLVAARTIADEDGYSIHHSGDLWPEGKAWAEAVDRAPSSVAAGLAVRFAELEPGLVGEWSDPVGASARCTDAAERFRDWAWSNDVDAIIRVHHDAVGPVRRPKGWVGRVGHVTVSVHGMTVDWTAAQFWPGATCPLIEPDDVYAARWAETADRDPQVR